MLPMEFMDLTYLGQGHILAGKSGTFFPSFMFFGKVKTLQKSHIVIERYKFVLMSLFTSDSDLRIELRNHVQTSIHFKKNLG